MDRHLLSSLFRRIFAWLPWLISAVAAGVLLWALLGQSTIALQVGDELRAVDQSVALAGDLTRQTADAMAPLTNTAMTLGSMNALLQSTVTDLRAINEAMNRIVGSQRAVLQGLGSLNAHTDAVVRLLGEVGTRNEAVLDATSALATQTEGEAATLKRLSASAGTSNRYLQTLSLRLAFLKSLPF